jgi:REP element-mobilizing transposase RayT
MPRKRTYAREGHAHFVSSSGFPRRRLLDHDRIKKAVLALRNMQMALQRGKGIGFVIMPGHVPAIVHLPDPDAIRRFMKPWEQRRSVPMQRLLRVALSW